MALKYITPVNQNGYFILDEEQENVNSFHSVDLAVTRLGISDNIFRHIDFNKSYGNSMIQALIS